MKYWNEVEEIVTDDPSWAPIVNGGGLYVEIWAVGDNQRIAIAYSRETKRSRYLYEYRQCVLEQNGLSLTDLEHLVKLAVPTEEYIKIYGLEKSNGVLNHVRMWIRHIFDWCRCER